MRAPSFFRHNLSVYAARWGPPLESPCTARLQLCPTAFTQGILGVFTMTASVLILILAEPRWVHFSGTVDTCAETVSNCLQHANTSAMLTC